MKQQDRRCPLVTRLAVKDLHTVCVGRSVEGARRGERGCRNEHSEGGHFEAQQGKHSNLRESVAENLRACLARVRRGYYTSSHRGRNDRSRHLCLAQCGTVQWIASPACGFSSPLPRSAAWPPPHGR